MADITRRPLNAVRLEVLKLATGRVDEPWSLIRRKGTSWRVMATFKTQALAKSAKRALDGGEVF